MSSEGNIFPSASDSNFAEVGHGRGCANVREAFAWQGEQLWGAGCCRAVGSGREWDGVDQDVVRISLIFMTHAGRAAWLCVSEVAAMLQR